MERKLVEHRMQFYVNITVSNINTNKVHTEGGVDAMYPVDVYFKWFDEVVQFSADGNTSFNSKKLLKIGYHAIISSGEYIGACKKIW